MFAKIKGETVVVYPYTREVWQSENPHTYFTQDRSLIDCYEGTEDQVETGCRVVAVKQEGVPYCPPNKNVSKNTTPHRNDDGDFVLGYTLSDKTGDDLATAEAEMIEQLSEKVVRAKQEYAHTIADDSTLSAERQAEWTAYFDALDNLASLDGYPWSFTYPACPSDEE